MDRVINYFRGAVKEIRRVTWPKRKEALKMTLAVIVFSLFFATFTGLIDAGLGYFFENYVLKG